MNRIWSSAGPCGPWRNEREHLTHRGPLAGNRSGLWRSSLSLECERHHGEVPVAEPLINCLLPFVSQGRKGGEAVVAGRLQGEAYVLERER
jgi:hypothetical protein